MHPHEALLLKSFTLRARRPSRAGSFSPTAIFLANLEPLERGIDAYRKYERWVHPLHFRHARSVEPCIRPIHGAVRSSAPRCRSRFRAVQQTPQKSFAPSGKNAPTALIAVPRMLDLFIAGIEREFEGQGKSQWLNGTLKNAKARNSQARLDVSLYPPPLWLEIFGLHLGSGFRMKPRLFQAHGLCRCSRLWHDGDSIFDQPESPVSRDGRLCRQDSPGP